MNGEPSLPPESAPSGAASAPVPGASTESSPEVPPADLQERIRELAYAMWEAGGHQHGRALEYWLEAESRLLAGGEAAKTTPSPSPPDRR